MQHLQAWSAEHLGMDDMWPAGEAPWQQKKEQPKQRVGHQKPTEVRGRFNNNVPNKANKLASAAVKKTAVKVKAKCKCGKKFRYHCVVQCEDCWQAIVDEAQEQRDKKRARVATDDLTWQAAPASAAAAAAASGAPVLATAQGVIKEIERTQPKFCNCGKLIANKMFNKCWNCNQKDKQLKQLADQDTSLLQEKLEAEVAAMKKNARELKAANEAFELTEMHDTIKREAKARGDSYGEDAQDE